MTIKRALVFLLLAILIAAAVNLPLATFFIKSRTDDKGEMIDNVIGTGAAAMDWPTATPHQHEWPRPTQWSEWRAFGYRNIHLWSRQEGQGRCSMDYQLIGWPLPVYERVRMWWAWDDPNWQTKSQSDPAMRLYWRGVLLNPLIIGGGLWLVFVFPLLAWVHVRTHLRRRRGHCPKCAYDLRGDFDAGCPECGWNRADTQA